MDGLRIKIIDWWYKVTHLSIKTFWINIKRWLAYYPVIRRTVDFDHTSILEVEYHQLTKVRDCLSKYGNDNIKYLNLAIACLGIVIEDGCSYSNGEQAFWIKPLSNGIKQLVPNDKHKYIMPIYVNTRNSKRFVDWYDDNNSLRELLQDQLRIEKAWYLYYKIRKEYTRLWWD